MTEYVEKQPLIEMFNNLASKYINGDKRQRGLAYTNAADLVALTEAADVQPVKRGKWEFNCGVVQCSCCKLTLNESAYGQLVKKVFGYCPKCGADMLNE